MKFNITLIILSLLSPITFADSISLPDDIGQDESPVPTVGSKLYKHPMPTTKNQADWIDWANGLLEAGRMNELAFATQVNPALTAQHTRIAARCLWLPGAFKYERLADNLYEVSCWAGSRKEITHALWYRFKVEYSNDCTNPARIEAYFSKMENMTSRGGAEFANAMNRACVLKVNPEVPLQSPVIKARKFDTKWFKEEKCNPDFPEKMEEICSQISQVRTSKPAIGTTSPTGLGSGPKNPFENAIPRESSAE